MVYQKDIDLEKRWVQLLSHLEDSISKRPKDLNAILFLIGMQELGRLGSFSKEEKQDLMHIATCKVLSYAGFYELEGIDPEGWPHWRRLKKLPRLSLMEQEKLLKINILEYFDKEIGVRVDGAFN